MLVKCFDEDFEVPDLLIEKYIKDFDGLPGNRHYEAVVMIRENITDIIDMVADFPETVEDPEQMADFIRALAMKKAMEKHGIFYDA